jgi:AcrR family transcriptional regulator
MGRWAPDAQGRLAVAAMDLFDERGFEDTTVADIAARAGLTKRTFFRYFGDKREVLFSGAEVLREKFVAGIATAPVDDSPLDVVAAGLAAVADLFAEMGERPRKRQAIIAANPDLQERELIKLNGYAGAGAAALRERGVGEPGATLAAEAGIAVLRVAFEEWVTGPEGQDLHQLLEHGLTELKSVAHS